MTDDEWFEQRRTTLNNRKTLGYVVDGHREPAGKQWNQAPKTRPQPAATWTPPDGAACLGATTIFYDEEHTHALAACHQCPHMWPCRHAALEQTNRNQHGVQGGLTADQRITIRRQWLNLDLTVMAVRRADALRESWTLRQRAEALALLAVC